eukprot:CAMPEP_0174322834 /NCGR_PEP_ID=MMETSP0810-20121108/11311_1 /TAXON_ID=73025 ORGANISM="Eutreptiella gymnastica-like, Strain CCMP1594" /NCGR_SAMPLE_ID=MMETSP0810 /ASSEMBLY_ACC=CAM_ASM_000659 /LENGTH=36 /DNA_ID= /DNA_START= /DNA_END= /DNA_ORIENTATION=
MKNINMAHNNRPQDGRHATEEHQVKHHDDAHCDQSR